MLMQGRNLSKKLIIMVSSKLYTGVVYNMAYIYGHNFATKCLKIPNLWLDDDDDDGGSDDDDNPFVTSDNTGGLPHPRVIHIKTYCSCVKLQIILNAIYNMI